MKYEIEFKDGIPDVHSGQKVQVLIATKSKHDGQIRTFAAYYLNEYPLEYEDGCKLCQSGDDSHENLDGCPTTGWFYDESNFEYDNCYHPIYGDVLKWASIPKYQPTS